jgi:hypothetical protein
MGTFGSVLSHVSSFFVRPNRPVRSQKTILHSIGVLGHFMTFVLSETRAAFFRALQIRILEEVY